MFRGSSAGILLRVLQATLLCIDFGLVGRVIWKTTCVFCVHIFDLIVEFIRK